MAENVDVRLRLIGARKFRSDAQGAGRSVGDIGDRSGRAAGQTDRLDKSSRKTRRGLMLLGTGAKYAGFALGGGLIVGLKASISAYEESRQVGAQTNAVLKSTGGVANVTGKEVDALTSSLMKKTAIDDETIRRGANMLLTFTNIRNETGKGNKVFNQATVAATNMAAALGTDTKDAALQLGKALNDPTKGTGRLMRSGVTFTEQQKNQIETLQKSGDVLGAQKIILREVSKEFGGSAAAQATPLKRLKVTMGELAETVGQKVAPFVDKGARALNKFLGQMQSGKGRGGAFAATLRKIWIEAKPIARWIGRAASRVGEFVKNHPKIVAFGVALFGLKAAAGKLTGGLFSRAGSRGGGGFVSGFKGGMGQFFGAKFGEYMMSRYGGRFTAAGKSAGTKMGTAAGPAVANSTAQGVTTSSRSGKLAGAFRGAGVVLGAAMALKVVNELGEAYLGWVDGLTGSAPGSSKRAQGTLNDLGMGTPGTEGNTVVDGLKRLFGASAKGGLISPGMAGGGMVVPRGEDTLRGLQFGEFVMRKEAVRDIGIGRLRAMNAGRDNVTSSSAPSPSEGSQTVHRHYHYLDGKPLKANVETRTTREKARR